MSNRFGTTIVVAIVTTAAGFAQDQWLSDGLGKPGWIPPFVDARQVGAYARVSDQARVLGRTPSGILAVTGNQLLMLGYPSVRWHVPLPVASTAGIHSWTFTDTSIVVLNDTPTEKDHLGFVLDARTGSLKASVALGKRGVFPAQVHSVGDGWFVGTSSTQVVGFTEDGSKHWSFSVGSEKTWSNVIDQSDSRILLGLGGDGAMRVERATGKHNSIGGCNLIGFAVDVDSIYVLCRGMAGLAAADAERREELLRALRVAWDVGDTQGAQKISQELQKIPVGSTAGGTSDFIKRLERGTYKQLWSKQVFSVAVGGPVLTADAVVFGSGTRTLRALDKRSGADLWKTEVANTVAGTGYVGLSVASPERILLGRASKSVMALSPASSAVLWATDVSGATRLYVEGETGGTVVAHADMEHQLWFFDAKSGQVIGYLNYGDGAVLARGPEDNRLIQDNGTILIAKDGQIWEIKGRQP